MTDPSGQQGMAPGDEAPPDEPTAGEDICPTCHGSGRTEDGETCPNCEGTGTVMGGATGA